ncbi:MAG: SufE family protein [Dehalococcoidia bacterium]|jgi:cysteine desulfuration protein SufE|uniref:SufE family protein n=1 Tax=Candidatus Amarobacter glycogenicus TaxID=3140699 RepID=UPI001DED5ECD|nr:SufE family protein [Dehalococcoidia bacterium]MBK6562771.1 SufE family protein [Dehalococcoidia bacterium]MBK7725477.1 SufE family protein [Dehalococcoidia bacterium]MBK9609961.1 SufE family protein [Dehalococcoidia bacterium]
MTAMPPDLERLLEDFKLAERSERIDMLIEYADRFEEVPGHIASRPFPEDHHVQKCESEAYVWAEDQPDGTLKYYFAVENPQGISAKAWSVIMDETLSGQPLEVVAATPSDIVFTVFGKEVSMGKGMGLMGITDLTTAFARQRLRARGVPIPTEER